MQFKSDDGKKVWDLNVAKRPDAYNKCIVKFAIDWAELMESRMEGGSEVKDVAEAASVAADTEGITGFMYGSAVTILSMYWIHGEMLRKWHNTETQRGNEGDNANENGGVLNPAVIRFPAIYPDHQ